VKDLGFKIKQWTKLRLGLEKPILTSSEVLPDPYDARDKIKVKHPKLKDTLPRKKSSLEFWAPKAPNQGKVGSCGPWSFRNMLYIISNRMAGTPIEIAPLDLYWYTRRLLGWLKEDSGVYLRHMFKVAKTFGVVPWEVFPERDDWRKEPPEYEDRFKIHSYESIPLGDLEMMKYVLDVEKLPINVGIRIPYSANYSLAYKRYGQIEDPGNRPPHKKDYGHAVLLVGYDEDWFYALNSWGPNSGSNGYLLLSHEFVKNTDYTFSAWTLSKDHS